jgi:hypothetical protein
MARGDRKKVLRAQKRNGPRDGFPVRVHRDLYPPPDYRFPNVEIGLTAQESKPDFPLPPRAPAGASNILLEFEGPGAESIEERHEQALRME